ncbi:MAG TPA: hypothetical protein VL053_03565 [Arachidicoccus sp.]|nr:hypothetical protein [Arachidicoccus sp.]
MTEAEIQIYEAEFGKMWDDHATLISAVEEGREVGKIEGKVEGKIEEREAIAKTLLRMGKQTIAEIATICKVSEEEVLKLKQELV